MKIVKLVIASMLALGVSSTVFAAEQIAEQDFLSEQPEDIKKYIIYLMGEGDSITLANNAAILSGVNKEYRRLVTEVLESVFKNSEEAQNTFIELSKKGKLSRFLLKILQTKGADLNKPDNRGNSALIWAAFSSHNKVLKILIDANVDLDYQDTEGCTALIEAANHGYVESAKILIEAHANLDKQDNEGYTALMLAAIMMDTKLVRLLINGNADLNKKNKHGDAALNLAKEYKKKYKGNEHKEIVQMLKNAGAKDPGWFKQKAALLIDNLSKKIKRL